MTDPIDTAREADLRAEMERLKAERAALIEARDMLGRFWEKEQGEAARLRAMLDEARNDLEALAGFTPLYDYVQGAKMDEPGSPFDRGRQRAYGEMQARIRATLAKIGVQHD